MRVGMIDTQGIRRRWECVGSKLDERGRRVFAAGEVRAAGRGGLAAVSAITGLARSTIGRGLKDLDAAPLPKGRERRKGGGRRRLSSRDATLIADLRSVYSPLDRRDGARALPESPRVDDHGRWRRLEWNACPAVEGRVAKARRPDRPRAPRPSLSAGYVEVEQDRAPPVLPHHPDLARATTRRSHGGRRADCCDDHQSWPES